MGMLRISLEALLSHWRRHPLQFFSILTGLWLATALWTGVQALNTQARADYARASAVLKGPADAKFTGDKTQFIEDVRQALYASKLCSYAQGYVQLDAAAKEFKWKLNNGNIALLWRGGCIIRSRFLGDIKAAFDKNPQLENLLLDDFFRAAIDKAQPSWRRVISTSVQLGLPIPVFSAALSYYDGYRNGRLPANLLQAQRDYFGAHTYERTDKPRGQMSHTDWIRERNLT